MFDAVIDDELVTDKVVVNLRILVSMLSETLAIKSITSKTRKIVSTPASGSFLAVSIGRAAPISIGELLLKSVWKDA